MDKMKTFNIYNRLTCIINTSSQSGGSNVGIWLSGFLMRCEIWWQKCPDDHQGGSNQMDGDLAMVHIRYPSTYNEQRKNMRKMTIWKMKIFVCKFELSPNHFYVIGVSNLYLCCID